MHKKRTAKSGSSCFQNPKLELYAAEIDAYAEFICEGRL